MYASYFSVGDNGC